MDGSSTALESSNTEQSVFLNTDANYDAEDELEAIFSLCEKQAQDENKKILASSKEPKWAKKGEKRPNQMAIAREEGLSKPIKSSNKGFQILSKMGYKEGLGLGKEQQGPVNPVDLHIKSGRLGLGVEEERRQRRLREEAEKQEAQAKKLKQDTMTQVEFQASNRTAFVLKRVLRDLKKAWSTFTELEERAGQVPDEILFAQLPALHPSPENLEGEEGAQEHEDKEPAPLEPQLQLLLGVLRERHRYCLYCGCVYETDAELAEICPGLTEEEH